MSNTFSYSNIKLHRNFKPTGIFSSAAARREAFAKNQEKNRSDYFDCLRRIVDCRAREEEDIFEESKDNDEYLMKAEETFERRKEKLSCCADSLDEKEINARENLEASESIFHEFLSDLEENKDTESAFAEGDSRCKRERANRTSVKKQKQKFRSREDKCESASSSSSSSSSRFCTATAAPTSAFSVGFPAKTLRDCECSLSLDKSDVTDDGAHGTNSGSFIQESRAYCKVNVANNSRFTRNFFANVLVQPDWISTPDTIPPDLALNYIVYLRPEGEKIIFLVVDGVCTARNKYGKVVDKFFCAAFSKGYTLLDCVLQKADFNARTGDVISQDKQSVNNVLLQSQQHKQKQSQRQKDKRDFEEDEKFYVSTYFICDVLCWKDNFFFNSSTECRLFFLKSRYEEISECLTKINEQNYSTFRLVDFRDVSVESLNFFYYNNFDYFKDSLVFIHREAHYLSGFNPLFIIFKDRNLSRYCTYFQCKSEDRRRLVAILELSENGFLRTADEITLGQITEEEQEKNFTLKFRSNVKVEIEDVDLVNRVLINVRIKGGASKFRSQPFPFNKIISTYIQSFENPITSFDDILQKVQF